jgi:pimeloyl-ACP methyl ester carboxylesterase
LVIVGGHDIYSPPHFAEELADAIPDAELAILDGKHFFYKQDPAPFHARVRDFLAEH